ncbi:MAG TPA: hypothetical protein VNG93_04855 [Candidatus Dormibacteraeota bacterium]|nr:hypothetical protein [Candidatus Dormibacteraeota bacterium]
MSIHASRGSQAVSAVSVAVGGIGLWLILTLPYGAHLGAGWRHEMISSSLGALAIIGGCWAQHRRWPQRAEVYAVAGVALAVVALASPLPKLAGLLILSVAMALGGLYALAAELRSPGPGPLLAAVAIVLGIVDLATIAPTFAFLAANGALQPPI